MSLVSKLKSFFKSDVPKVSSEYQVYRRQRLIEGGAWGTQPFYQQHLQSFTKEVPLGEWRQVNSMARKMYWNVGLVNHAIDSRAMMTIGKAMKPIFQGENKEWGAKAEAWLNDWFQICYVDGMSWWDGLFLESVAIDRDGDALTILTTSESGFPQLQIVPWHQIGSRDSTIPLVIKEGAYAGYREDNGVILNSAGRAIAYRILGETLDQDRIVSAQSAMLTRDHREIGQVRGISGLAPAIMGLRALKDLGDDIRFAANAHAKLTFIVNNEQGMADPADPAYALADNGSFNQSNNIRMEQMQGGMVQYMRANAGESIKAFETNFPSEAQDRLQERIIRDALLAMGWPPELGWDMSKLGGASARIMLEMANRSITDRHQYLSQFCKRRCAFAIARAVEMGLLPRYTGSDAARGGAYQFRFSAPPLLTADAGYASRDAIEAYRAGMRSMTDILSAGGMTLDQHLDEVEKEEIEIRKRMERSGLPRSVFGILTPNGQPQDMVPPPQNV
jgi:capsid protein